MKIKKLILRLLGYNKVKYYVKSDFGGFRDIYKFEKNRKNKK